MFELLTDKKILTLALFIVSIIIKSFLVRYFKKRRHRADKDSRLMVNTLRNIINLSVVILLFILWAKELQQFAFSIAAFVVAIVLATRELIQCVIGFIYLSSTTPFRIGDWIQTGNYTGEVTSTDWIKVTLLEVSQDSYSYTGKSVFIPNSQLMTQPIKNLNYMRRYVNHSFSLVKNDAGINPFIFEQPILDKAKEYCGPFNDVAERYNGLIQNRLDIKISGPEPHIEFTTTDLGRTKITISIFCPTEQARIIEQKLINDFFTLWQAEKKSRSTPDEVSDVTDG
ncbi:MAG: mechanosensitive ion channel family protein [Thalassotalea sp.]